MHGSYKNKWQILFATTISSMLVYIDVTAIPIAVPTIEKELSMSPTDGLWLVNAYLLTLLSFFFIGGKLAQVWGKKVLLISGFILFGLGSLSAAMSHDGLWLIMSRGLQGIGGAFSFPTMTSILLEHFPVNERGKALGINSGISAACLMLGPALGGLFVQYLSWRYIFWINIPIIIYGVTACYFILPEDKHKGGKLHLLSSLLVMIGSACLVIALMEGGRLGWSSPIVIALLVISVLTAILFIYISKRTEHPLIDFTLLHKLHFNAINLGFFLTRIIVCFQVFFVIYLQKQLHYTPAQTGLLMVFGTIPALFFNPLAGYLTSHVTPRIPAIVGVTLLFASFLFIHFFPPAMGYFYILAFLLLMGCGGSLIGTPFFIAATHSIPHSHLAGAVTILKATRQFAATFGIALIAAIIKQATHEGSYNEGLLILNDSFIIISFLSLLVTIFFVKIYPANHHHHQSEGTKNK